MDYKYINQLLERYWSGETSLEEEKILRTFFSQEDLPAELQRYKDLFAYQGAQRKEETLGEDFDRKLMAAINAEREPKAHAVTLTRRLRPLFKSAAIVAIFLTLGNAAQVSLNPETPAQVTGADNGYRVMPTVGASVTLKDSVKVDSMHRFNLQVSDENTKGVFIK